MADTKPGISKSEMEVLQTLWQHGPGTIREITSCLPAGRQSLAYTTVQTLLNRLEAKGYAVSDKTTVPNVFRAEVSREALVKHRLRGLIDDLCDGTALPIVAALIKDRRFGKKDIERFRALLDEVEPKKD